LDEKNIRFKELRSYLELSQEKLGSRIGLSKSGISNIESGLRSVTETHIKLLESAFGINGDWLRQGIGYMFVDNENISLDDFVRQKDVTKSELETIKAYLNIEPLKRKELFTTIKLLFSDSDVFGQDISNSPKKSESCEIDLISVEKRTEKPYSLQINKNIEPNIQVSDNEEAFPNELTTEHQLEEKEIDEPPTAPRVNRTLARMKERQAKAPVGMTYRTARSEDHTEGQWIASDEKRSEKLKTAPVVTDL